MITRMTDTSKVRKGREIYFIRLDEHPEESVKCESWLMSLFLDVSLLERISESRGTAHVNYSVGKVHI
jgi:hypothetical protein